MGKTGISYNLIDADSCTFNKKYRRRILHLIFNHRDVIDEYGDRFITKVEDKLLRSFERVLLVDQEKFHLSDKDFNALLADIAPLVEKFNSTEEPTERQDRKLSRYIYHYIEKMELILYKCLREVYWRSNSELVKAIKEQKREYGRVGMAVGSNRQAKRFDVINSQNQGTASIFIELAAFADRLKVELEPFTLVDLKKNKTSSCNNFEKILSGETVTEKNAFDDSKVNIIYAFCHRVADKNMKATQKNKKPEERITVNLWDDHEGILRDLKTFFTAHPTLLPNGLILNLRKYDGRLGKMDTIIGTGALDRNYKKNTQLMANLVGYKEGEEQMEPLSIANALNVADFSRQRVISKEKKVIPAALFQPASSVANDVPAATPSVQSAPN